MKYVIVLGDGMADEPIEAAGGKTPLQLADKPVMDEMAKVSEQGIAYTVPSNLPAGSDVANLSMLGYDPQVYYLIEAVRKELEDDEYKFYPGVSYRHLTIWDHGEVVELVPPHDVLGQKIGQYLPKQEKLKEMMEKSFDILNHHPINEARAEKGLNKANSIWFWGAGTKPALDDFKEKTGMNGAMVSAVDLLKGIAVGANMRNLDVEGANGGLDTNYHGKAMAAVEALLEKNDDFAYIHVEAPDEMGHQGSLENKIKAIEHLDKEVVKVVKEELEKAGEDFRILIGPDHPTPIAIRTHSKEPIPFMIYDSTKDYEGQEEYSEEAAKETGIVISHAYDLMNRLLQK